MSELSRVLPCALYLSAIRGCGGKWYCSHCQCLYHSINTIVDPRFACGSNDSNRDRRKDTEKRKKGFMSYSREIAAIGFFHSQ